MIGITAVLDPIFEIFNRFLSTFLSEDWVEIMSIPLLMCLLIMPLTAMVGTIVVNARMSFFTSAISHSAFTGVALGVLFGASPTAAMFVFGCALALLITFLQNKSVVPVDSLVGVVQTLSVATGLVIISVFKYQKVDQFLFGDILFTTQMDVVIALFALLGVVAFMTLSYNKLLLIGLNHSLAKASGVHVALYEYTFSLTVAIVVMMSINTIGVLLVAAVIIIPASAGRNFSWSAGSMIWMSVVVSILSGIIGLAVSYRFDSLPGATIIFVSGIFFILSMIYRKVTQKLAFSRYLNP